MLQMIPRHGCFDDDGVLYVPLDDWQIDILCSLRTSDMELEDGDDEVQLDQYRLAQHSP